MTYSPGQAEEKIIPYVISSLLRGEAPKLYIGKWQADWIYLCDVIDGLLAAAATSEVEERIVDLGSGRLMFIGDIVDYIDDLTQPSVVPDFGAYLIGRWNKHERLRYI